MDKKEKCDTCTCYECDCEECTCECHEATAKYNSLVNSTDYEGHWLHDSADVAEKGND